MRPVAVMIALLGVLGLGLVLGPMANENGAAAAQRQPTEQDNAAEKFFSALEASLAEKFFDARRRPVIRVAVFAFTDNRGNGIRAGRELAEKLTRRLHQQSQFAPVSQEKLRRFLVLNGRNTMGRMDAQAFAHFQRRINTLEPGHGIHALVTGEVQKGMGRNLRVTATVYNFEEAPGAVALEKNLVDVARVQADIPYPTEKALQEATEILLPGLDRPLVEGRLVILANTRGHHVLATARARDFGVDRPFAWEENPYVLILGKEEVNMPGEIKVGLDHLVLAPREFRKESRERLEYAFLHGKFGTNEVYFDEPVPAEAYGLVTSFLDLKTNETYSEQAAVQVHSDATTLVVLSYYVPSEKERMRNKQVPGIHIYQLLGKGRELLPKR